MTIFDDAKNAKRIQELETENRLIHEVLHMTSQQNTSLHELCTTLTNLCDDLRDDFKRISDDCEGRLINHVIWRSDLEGVARLAAVKRFEAANRVDIAQRVVFRYFIKAVEETNRRILEKPVASPEDDATTNDA